MAGEFNPTSLGSDADRRRRVDRVADEFERHWQADREPDLERYMAAFDGELRLELLKELVHLDLDLAARACLQRDLADYARRFPELLDQQGALPEEFAAHQDSARTLSLAAGHEEQPRGVASWELAPGLNGSPSATSDIVRLGRFEIQGCLGEGAFSRVYRAWDTTLKRFVALKIPRAGRLLEGDELERLLREARSAAKLRHVGIVPLYDIIQQGGVTCLVSELIEGPTLAEVQKQRRLTFRESSELVLHVAEALQAAHAEQIFHRDVKPSNILLDAAGRPHLTDFGLASAGNTESALSVHGDVLGTPAYMAPEQASGRPDLADARSDVYSLGVVLFELLTQRRPFLGDVRQVLRQVKSAEPPAPRKINARIPRDLETICLTAMSKLPADRYATASGLAEDLRRFLQDQPILATKAHFLKRTLRYGRRHWTSLIAAALIVALVVGLALRWWLTPGVLTLSVRPVGAKIDLANKRYVAAETPLEIRLPAGAYRVDVDAADFTRETRDIVLTRGQNRTLRIDLLHDMGRLELECDPLGAEIEINGTRYGSRISNLQFPTGEYRIQARLDQHLDSPILNVRLAQGETFRRRFSLDDDVVWQYRSPNLQGQLVVVGDQDGDGIPEIASNHLQGLVVFSGADGKPIFEREIADANAQIFQDLDLKGDVGHVLVMGADEAATDTVDGGVHVIVRRLADMRSDWWDWHGPAHRHNKYRSFSMLSMPDQNNDGVDELVGVGWDGWVFVLDGRRGTQLHGYRIADGPTINQPTLRASLGNQVTCWFQVPDPLAEGSPTETQIERIDLAEGKCVWRCRTDAREFWPIDVNGDGVLEQLLISENHWRVLDLVSGKFLAQAEQGGERADWNWATADVDHDGTSEVIAISKQPTHSTRCFRLPDASVNWESPIWSRRAPVVDKLGRLDGTARDSLLIVRDDELCALDALTGKKQWSFAGEVDGWVRADWDADGSPELLAGLRRQGVACLGPTGTLRWLARTSQSVVPTSLLPDVDGDGLGEVLCTRGSALISVLRGPRQLWRVTAAGPLQASPLAIDADGDGRDEIFQSGDWGESRGIACLDGTTAALRWRTSDFDFPPNTAPTTGDWNRDGIRDLIAYGDRKGKSQAWLCGWSSRDGQRIMAHRLDSNGYCYAPYLALDLNDDEQLDAVLPRFEANDVVAIDGRNGKRLWTKTTQAPNYGGLCAGNFDGDGLLDVAIPSLDGHLYVLRGQDGHEIWSVKLVGEADAVPAARDFDGDGCDEVVLVSGEGVLQVLDPARQQEVWRSNLPRASHSRGRPALLDVAQETWIVCTLGDAGAVALDARTSDVRWQALGIMRGSPVVVDVDHDGRMEVILTTEDGEVRIVDLESGTLLWKLALSKQRLRTEPAVTDLNQDGILDLIVPTLDFHLFAIDGQSIRSARLRKLALRD